MASALGHEDRPVEKENKPAGRVPTGWDRIAAKRPTPEEPPDPAGPAKAAASPAGWGGVASKLGGPTTSTRPSLEKSEPTDAGTTGASGPRPAGASDLEEGDPAGDGAGRRGITPRLLAVGGGVVVIVVALVLVAVLIVFSGGGLSSGDAFSVNGHKTTVAQFNSQLHVIEQVDGVKPPAKSDKAAYAKFLKTAAQSQATEELINQLARKAKVTYSQKQARDQLDSTVQSQYQGSQPAFEAALHKSGVTEAEYLQFLTEQGLGQLLLKKVTKAPSVTQADVNAAYQQNQASLKTPETRALSAIEVGDQNTASSILGQLQGGAAFATLAEQDSQDTSKTNGGSLGTFQQGQLPAALAGPTFGAALNQPFGPVELSSSSWVVGEVTAITPATNYANDAQTTEGIANWLNDKGLRSQWIAYLEKALKSNSIRYSDTYRPANPGIAPQSPLPSLVTYVEQAHTTSSSSSTGASASGGSAGSGVTSP